MYKVTVLFEDGTSRTRFSETLAMARLVKRSETQKRTCVFWMIMFGDDIIEHA